MSLKYLFVFTSFILFSCFFLFLPTNVKAAQIFSDDLNGQWSQQGSGCFNGGSSYAQLPPNWNPYNLSSQNCTQIEYFQWYSNPYSVKITTDINQSDSASIGGIYRTVTATGGLTYTLTGHSYRFYNRSADRVAFQFCNPSCGSLTYKPEYGLHGTGSWFSFFESAIAPAGTTSLKVYLLGGSSSSFGPNDPADDVYFDDITLSDHSTTTSSPAPSSSPTPRSSPGGSTDPTSCSNYPSCPSGLTCAAATSCTPTNACGSGGTHFYCNSNQVVCDSSCPSTNITWTDYSALCSASNQPHINLAWSYSGVGPGGYGLYKKLHSSASWPTSPQCLGYTTTYDDYDVTASTQYDYMMIPYLTTSCTTQFQGGSPQITVQTQSCSSVDLIVYEFHLTDSSLHSFLILFRMTYSNLL